MSKYFSLIYIYNKAAYKKLLIVLAAIPASFAILFLVKAGIKTNTDSFMLMERSFDGILSVLAFVIVNVITLLIVVNSVNGKKALKASHSTIGYTVRRMHMSPIISYLSIYAYYILIIIIIWGVAILSLLSIGERGLSLAGSTNIEPRLALGILRTDIGHALIPIADPTVMIFNILAVLSLAGECARSCYLSWHNGRHTAGMLIVSISMFVVWSYNLNNSYLLIVILVLFLYAGFSFGDVISREKHPKGDPFMVNKYVGIIDMDSVDFDENTFMETNSHVGTFDTVDNEAMLIDRYGMNDGDTRKTKRLNPFYQRRRYLPIGINMERTNFIFGACIFVGIVGNVMFLGRYLLKLQDIKNSITGITIDSEMKMPYFWDLQKHAYYGFIIAIILVFVLQAYLSYSYFNKETKSVFVMKRLPNRKEYLRTIWVAPAIESCFIIVIMIAQTLINLGMYILATPGAALQTDYLQHILPF